MPDWSWQRRLGAGAFGEVWLVVDRALGATRAVKLIRPERLHDRTNFYSEPHALVQLKHRNIVEVHDAGTLVDGRVYIAMEYIEEGSVEDQVGGAVLPVSEALAIVADACRGIEFAHSRGFIHRDVKPANLLRHRTTTKVSDFGLATRTAGTGVASPYGYVVHCAPEVLDPGETTVQTDVYALGMTLYRLLNGDALLPDPASLQMPLDQAIREGRFPDRNRFRDHVPAGVVRIVKRAIAFDRGDRTASASALRHDIERVMPAVSFREVASREVATWEGESATHRYQASIEKKLDGYRFLIRRATRGGSRWVKMQDSGLAPTEASARKIARTALQALGKPR